MKIDIKAIVDILRKPIDGKPITIEEQKMIRGAIEAHFFEPQKQAETFKRMIMASETGSGVSSNFPEMSSAAFKVFQEMPQWDNFYELAFDLVEAVDGRWDIFDVTDGIAIEKVPEGHKLKVRSFSGERQTAYTAKYGAAVQWSEEMIRHRQIARMIQMMPKMRNRYYSYKADQHYGLLADAAPADNSNANVTTYNATATNSQVTRDIDTIDSANYTLMARHTEDGYTQSEPILYLPMSMKKRLGRAFRVSDFQLPVSNSQTAGTQLDVLEYGVRPIFTWNSYIPANTGIMVLPGNQIQRADEVQPYMLTDEDILSLQYILAIWAWYGAAIGDTSQVQRVLFA